jgi:hypothetical protein
MNATINSYNSLMSFWKRNINAEIKLKEILMVLKNN